MTHDLLTRIVSAKKKEIASLPRSALARASGPSFADAIRSRRPSVIAEIKPRSPLGGTLIDRDGIEAIVNIYDRHAQAISVLCDREFFGGGYDLLSHVRRLTGKPLLCKEFILDDRQLDLAATHGANAVLLIAAILGDVSLKALTSGALERGLDVLIETHDRKDVERVCAIVGSRPIDDKSRIIIGVNNRDLRSAAIDRSATKALAPVIRERLPGIAGIISESGISTLDQAKELSPMVDGFLIGTSILQSNDPESFLQSLLLS